LPIFQVSALVNKLGTLGVNCKVGNPSLDIPAVRRPYFERWLLHRDGFIKMYDENIDYIGVEDIVRIGPFYNIYCLIENQDVRENDDNCSNLLCANPYFDLHNRKVIKLGWSGGVLADILTNDITLYDFLVKNIMKEEIRKMSVKVANYACIIETRVWDTLDIASIYQVIDIIGFKIKELLEQVHLGEESEFK
jgi:hypothetical protein